ncbi:hypothetical protein [Microbacter margulisiae]|uniref:Uncharacterized protein n=1 Tax=Microbacter margulisiae TaxID=1350067 RepID=A0A7W5H1F1_9PORP|nr:hypothetical protein [Microbacter margulisiae]MBB3186635.1 hypothetical protein [Microbacter margulisiae]
MEKIFNKVINDMRTILNDKYNGIATEEFIKLAKETKEKFKDNLQDINDLSIDQSLLIDKMFDEFIESL